MLWKHHEWQAIIPCFYWCSKNHAPRAIIQIELRDVTLSYSFPKRWIGKLGLGNLTVSVSGNTLVYWTKVKGVSPESAVAASGSSTGMYSVVNTSSADYSIYPPTRKVMFSLKATF